MQSQNSDKAPSYLREYFAANRAASELARARLDVVALRESVMDAYEQTDATANCCELDLLR